MIHDRNVHACCRFWSSIYSLSGGCAHASRSTAVGLTLLLHASHSGSRQSGEIMVICNNVKQITKPSVFPSEFSWFFFYRHSKKIPVPNKCNCEQIHGILRLQVHLLCTKCRGS